MSLVADRRKAIIAAVGAYNRAHPLAPLPHSAARLLAVMFASDDVCRWSLEALAAEGSRATPSPVCCARSSKRASCRSRPAQPGSRTPIASASLQRSTHDGPSRPLKSQSGAQNLARYRNPSRMDPIPGNVLSSAPT